MRNTYLLPLWLCNLIGPHKSICINSSGLEVVTTFFGLKDDLTCFPLVQGSQISSLRNFIGGNPLTRSFDLKELIKVKLA